MLFCLCLNLTLEKETGQFALYRKNWFLINRKKNIYKIYQKYFYNYNFVLHSELFFFYFVKFGNIDLFYLFLFI